MLHRKVKILIGLAFPVGAAWSLAKKGFLVIPIPFRPYSRVGFSVNNAPFIFKIFVNFFRVRVATWGGRIYIQLRQFKGQVTYFEDGFYRSEGHWKNVRIPERVAYEHGAPYFLNSQDSRLTKAIESSECFDLPKVKKMALSEFNAITSGRGKYGRFASGFSGKPTPAKVVALQDGMDSQITLSKNYKSLYPIFKEYINTHPVSAIRGHPNNVNKSLLSGSFSDLKSNGVKNLVVYNSTSGLEAIINGIPVTYYGDSPVLRILDYENLVLPVTIIPTEEVVWRLTLAFYVIYPI